MQGRIAELFTKTESTGLKNHIAMRLLFKRGVSPDLISGDPNGDLHREGIPLHPSLL
jgi:hypothetical protein